MKLFNKSKTILFFMVGLFQGACLHVSAVATMEPIAAHIKSLLDNNKNKLKNIINKCKNSSDCDSTLFSESYEWLPKNYMLKYGVKRVANAQRLREVIEEKQIPFIKVAQHYLYKIDETPGFTNENSLVLIKVPSGNYEPLNFTMTQELNNFALTEGYFGLCERRSVKRVGDTIFLCDTSDVAMPSEEIKLKAKIEWFLKGNIWPEKGETHSIIDPTEWFQSQMARPKLLEPHYYRLLDERSGIYMDSFIKRRNANRIYLKNKVTEQLNIQVDSIKEFNNLTQEQQDAIKIAAEEAYSYFPQESLSDRLKTFVRWNRIKVTTKNMTRLGIIIVASGAYMLFEGAKKILSPVFKIS